MVQSSLLDESVLSRSDTAAIVGERWMIPLSQISREKNGNSILRDQVQKWKTQIQQPIKIPIIGPNPEYFLEGARRIV
jgi:hypothetical protein